MVKRNIKGALVRFACAAVLFHMAWDHWHMMNALESGADVHVKMFAPLAWLYNLGGVWSPIAKWASHVGSALLGLGALIWGIYDLRGVPFGESN